MIGSWTPLTETIAAERICTDPKRDMSSIIERSLFCLTLVDHWCQQWRHVRRLDIVSFVSVHGDISNNHIEPIIDQMFDCSISLDSIDWRWFVKALTRLSSMSPVLKRPDEKAFVSLDVSVVDEYIDWKSVSIDEKLERRLEDLHRRDSWRLCSTDDKHCDCAID